MNKSRHTTQLAVFVIIRNDKGEVLLIRRTNTDWDDGKYTFPSGHVESGEAVLAACVREVREEVELEVSEKDLILKNVTQYRGRSEGERDHINFYFECTDYHNEAKIGEPDKSDDLIWLSPEKLGEVPMSDTAKFSFEKAESSETFAVWGFENEDKETN